MPDEHEDVERIERDLRRLRVRDPAPDLRARVLQAARSTCVVDKERPADTSWRRSWAVEGLLAAALSLVLWLTAVVDAQDVRRPPAVGGEAVADYCTVLGKAPDDWECRRMAAAARSAVPATWLTSQMSEQTNDGELQ